jgi:hypothetical protein
MAQLTQRLGFDLANALAGDGERPEGSLNSSGRTDASKGTYGRDPKV